MTDNKIAQSKQEHPRAFQSLREINYTTHLTPKLWEHYDDVLYRLLTDIEHKAKELHNQNLLEDKSTLAFNEDPQTFFNSIKEYFSNDTIKWILADIAKKKKEKTKDEQ